MDKQTCDLIELLHKKYQKEMDQHAIKTLEHQAIEQGDQSKAQEHARSTEINANLESTSHICTSLVELSPNDCKAIKDAIDSWNAELTKYTSKFEKIPIVNRNIKKERKFIADIHNLLDKHCK